jgi:23S rRNA pseudouridine1911/1915/1917 synthase
LQESKKIVVSDLDSQIRVDLFLSKVLDESRNQIEKLISSKNIIINNKKISKPSFKVKNNDIIELKLTKHSSENKNNLSQNIDFDIEILYEDEYLMVLNKPSNLVVHSAPSVSEATLVDWLKTKNISLSTLSGEERHGIVHRLDKNTTGAILIAKDNKTHQLLSEQLSNKTMGRFYLAIINQPLKENILVDKPILRNPSNRLKMTFLSESLKSKFRNLKSRDAKTYFHKFNLSKNQQEELILCKLFTGRTHQIRVHLNALNRYVLGDDLYKFKSVNNKINTIMLHAYLLYFDHPVTKNKIFIKAPLNNKMDDYLIKKFNLNLKTEEKDKELNETLIEIDKKF